MQEEHLELQKIALFRTQKQLLVTRILQKEDTLVRLHLI
nr:MAG TPA: hypothetical protein [Bacteriophage sp.]